MTIQDNIEKVIQEIRGCESLYHREPNSVTLLAVSKAQSQDAIRKAYAAGLRDFGESYYQELLTKTQVLQDLPLGWHFIGPIQSNKAAGIAEHCDWVHSLDRLKIALALNSHRPHNKPPLQVCLQIKLAIDANKSGIAPREAYQLAQVVSQLPQLRLRGLMTIPPAHYNEEQAYTLFLQLKQLLEDINQAAHLHMDTLSMGMTNDLEPAIKAGSTLVRIGRAIFK
jgi:pyridoxal phosphate enzyme (YggS family)